MYWALWTGFCIGKCIAGWLAAGCLLLLLSFSFSFYCLSFHTSFGIEVDKNIVKKISPKTVGPLYLLPPLLITSGSELTLFTAPLLITTPHYEGRNCFRISPEAGDNER